MSFMKETVAQSLPIWDACLNSPFIRELKEGTLPPDKFHLYMIQDSIYLKHYARVYGKAIYHAASLRDIQVFYSMLSFLTESESAVRLRYLSDAGLTDDDIEDYPPLPENQNYINFMMETASRGNINEILMAVLPCMLSYSYLFRALVSGAEPVSPVYFDFITDYADDGYHRACISWSQFADAKCAGLSQEEKSALQAIFRQGSLLELDFWNMAYRTTEKER